jgi:hypothetical protein
MSEVFEPTAPAHDTTVSFDGGQNTPVGIYCQQIGVGFSVALGGGLSRREVLHGRDTSALR